MAKKVYRGFRGLITNPNQLEVVDGALAQADDISLTRPGVIRPRKGFDTHSTLGGSGNRASAHMWEYGGSVFAHTNDGGSDHRIRIESSGTWTEVPGGEMTDPATDYKLHSAETANVCYFVESQGLRKIEGTSADIAFAGVPRCPDFDRYQSAVEADANGVLPTNMQRAYRATILYRRAADNAEMEGSPSGRTTMRNSLGGNAKPTVRVRLPMLAGTDEEKLTTDYWVRVYASPMSTLTVEPFEDFGLIFEGQLTAGNIAAGYLDVADITPDELRGQHLYTDPSQQGIAQMNEVPPFAKCVSQYKGAILLANIENRKQLELQILVVGGANGIQTGETITIEDGLGLSFKITAAAAPAVASEYKLETGGTSSQNVTWTAQNIVSAINRHTSNTFVYAYYMGNPSDPRSLGRILLVKRSFSAGSIYPFVGGTDKNKCFEPTLPQGSSSTQVAPEFEDFRNGWAMSKVSQGDAYPPALNGRMGPGDVVRIVATNEAAYFFHSQGEVWIMTGEPPVNGLGGTLRLERWRSELTLLSPESAKVMDGVLYALTDRGVVGITPGGYTIPSEAIAPTIAEKRAAVDNLMTDVWSFVHPIDRRYGIGFQVDGAWTFYVYQADEESWVTINRDFQSGTWVHFERRLRVSQADDVYRENEQGDAAQYADDGADIAATWALPQFISGDGSVPHQLREIQMLSEGSQAPALTVGVATNSSTGSVSIDSLSTGDFRATVPVSAQRALRHSISCTVSSVIEWGVGGMVLLFNPYAERGTK